MIDANFRGNSTPLATIEPCIPKIGMPPDFTIEYPVTKSEDTCDVDASHDMCNNTDTESVISYRWPKD